jgi:hypothetical protein
MHPAFISLAQMAVTVREAQLLSTGTNVLTGHHALANDVVIQLLLTIWWNSDGTANPH